jgi:hypothetical protein
MLVEREKDKKPLTDRTIDTYDYVINKLINTDVYETLIPIFSEKEITRDNPFFDTYQISAKEGLTSDEYKTISYMGQFYKEKVKYNPKEIVRYLQFIGYNDTKKEDAFILVVSSDQTTIDESQCLTYIDYLEVGKKLPNAMAFEDYQEIAELEQYPKIIAKVNHIIDYEYIDGFDKFFGIGDTK